jgi:hypothetical protein
MFRLLHLDKSAAPPDPPLATLILRACASRLALVLTAAAALPAEDPADATTAGAGVDACAVGFGPGLRVGVTFSSRRWLRRARRCGAWPDRGRRALVDEAGALLPAPSRLAGRRFPGVSSAAEDRRDERGGSYLLLFPPEDVSNIILPVAERMSWGVVGDGEEPPRMDCGVLTVEELDLRVFGRRRELWLVSHDLMSSEASSLTMTAGSVLESFSIGS